MKAPAERCFEKSAGWIRVGDEPWETTMHRMKIRVQRALQQYSVKPWSARIAAYLWKMVLRIKLAGSESWINESSMWIPSEIEDAFSQYVPYRYIGRPTLKWDSVVNSFCNMHHHDSWQNLSIDILNRSMDAFVQYFCNRVSEIII